MTDRTFWQNHVTEYAGRYSVVEHEDGTITLIPVEGDIVQQGTPQDETNFNALEERAWEAGQLAAENARVLIHHDLALRKVVGESDVITLNNSQEYPFNDSKQTVALKQRRDNVNYIVKVDIAAVGTGCVGDVVISDKQVNGFKVEYTGSVKQAKLCYIVEGGMN